MKANALAIAGGMLILAACAPDATDHASKNSLPSPGRPRAIAVVPPDTILAPPDPPPGDTLLTGWMLSIDSIAESHDDAQERLALVNHRAMPMAQAETLSPNVGVEAEIHILRASSGKSLRHAERPIGEVEAQATHYFDSAGRTRVFYTIAEYFMQDCVDGRIVDTRRLVYDTSGNIVHSGQHLADRSGASLSEEECRKDYPVFHITPMPNYEALVRDGRATNLNPPKLRR